MGWGASGWQWFAQGWAAWMMGIAWQVAVLAGIVWAASKLLPKTSAAFRYGLWLLVFVKLVVPPSLAVPWSVANLFSYAYVSAGMPIAPPWPAPVPRLPRASAPVHPGAPLAARIPETAASFPEDVVALPENSFSSSPPIPESARDAVDTAPFHRVARLALIVWAAVGLSMMIMMAVQFRRYSRRVMENSVPLQGPLLAIAQAQAERLGLRRHFEIRSTPQLRVPAVLLLRCPVVLVPDGLIEALTHEQIKDLLCHELAHVKRRDIELGWVASLLLCIYWFHPAVWLANLNLRREREMACDDKVLYITRQEGRTYAATILRVAEAFDGGVPAGAGLLGLLEIADNLLQRIRSVSDLGRPRRVTKRAVALLLLLSALLLPMGIWTTASAADAAESINAEIERSYAPASAEVKDFVRWTAEHFGPQGLWLPEDAFAKLSAEERAAKLKGLREALEGADALNAYSAIAEAGALRAPELLPGLVKVAWHMQEGGQDNRSKWMAVVALGRIGDKRAVPVLVPLLDHYNKNVRLWAQASLVRLSGQSFGADKAAWTKWANAAGPDSAIAPAVLEWASRQSEERMKNNTAQESPKSAEGGAAIEQEIQEHYLKADADVQEYIRWTASTFGRGGTLWKAANTFDRLSPEEREKKVLYTEEVLKSDYGRHLCTALADAGALKDKRLLPGVIKAAAYHRDDSDYDCRAKWMAVAALGRLDDESGVPVLVPLVDHGNQNTRMWARASLVRLTGQNFGVDKQAWAKWWNDGGKQPPIDVTQLKPWTPPGDSQAASPGTLQLSESVPEGAKGPQNGYLRFDGTDDLIHFPSMPALDLNNDFSVSAWANVAPECGESPLYIRGDQQRAHDPCQLLVNDNRMNFLMFGGSGGEEGKVITGSPLESGWHLWTGVCDGKARKLLLYKDGKLAAEAAAPPSVQYPTSGMYNEIGSIDSGAWGGWGFYKGAIDQVSVWRVARTAGDIQAEFKNGLRGDEEGLVALWNFDEEGQEVLDASASKCNTTLGRTAGVDPSDPARSRLNPGK